MSYIPEYGRIYYAFCRQLRMSGVPEAQASEACFFCDRAGEELLSRLKPGAKTDGRRAALDAYILAKAYYDWLRQYLSLQRAQRMTLGELSVSEENRTEWESAAGILRDCEKRIADLLVDEDFCFIGCGGEADE